jgi:small subunit ribosomal protein SAe
MAQVPQVLAPKDEDIAKLLACQVHVGSKNLDFQMADYMWARRPDGHFILNLGKTWEKLMLAARIIVAIENPADVCVISSRPFGQRAVLKFAQYTGAQSIVGRYTPGTFTNQIEKKFREPRLLIVTDPHTDHQPVREASYVNLPVIAFCNSDSPVRWVDVAIPANNSARLSVGLMYWLLAREVLRLRGTVSRTSPWSVMTDLFFFVDPEQQQENEANAAAAAPALAPAADDGEGYDATAAGYGDGDWEEAPSTRREWGAPPQAEVPAAAGWEGATPPAQSQW